jgi:hypothetical protein
VLFWISLYTLVNIALAYTDYRLISEGERVFHGINGAVYLILISPAYFLTNSLFVVAGLLVLRRLVFDVSLNLFRGLPYDYISRTTTSIIDRLLYDIQEVLGPVYYAILIVTVILLMK